MQKLSGTHGGYDSRDHSQVSGETVLSHKLSGSADVSRRSLEDFSPRTFRLEGSGSGVPIGMGNPSDFEERDSGETVLSDKLFCLGVISDGLWGQDSEVAKHESVHDKQQQADVRQENYSAMAITIVPYGNGLAQTSPVRCDRTLDVDTDSTSESSDSWFC